MTAIKNTTFVLLCAILPFAAHCTESVEVRVKNTPTGPRLFVDGKMTPARFFFGSPQNVTIVTQTHKVKLIIPFVADEDTESATIVFKTSKANKPITFSGAKLIDLTERSETALTAADESTHTFKRENLHLKKSHRYQFHVFHRAKHFRQPLSYEIYYTTKDGIKKVIPLPYGETLIDTVRMAGRHGFNLITFSTENSWGCQSWWSPPEKERTYGDIDEMCESLIKANPNVLLIPRISANAPKWMLERDPTLRMKFNDSFTIEMSSISSREYRKAACKEVELLARHLQKKFPRNFAGLHISGQNSAEWFYMLSQTRDLSGYDIHTRNAFREYLAERGDKDAMVAEVPSVAERTATRPGFRLDEKLDKRVIEFGRFRQYEMASFINDLGAAVRRGTDNKSLALFFYGYTWEVGNVPAGAAESGHFFVDWILKNAHENIDGISAPFSYAERGLPGSTAVMSAAETIMRSGILWINEDDTRTHHEELWTGAIKMSGFVNKSAWNTRNFLLRNSAKCIIRGHADWWMDLCGRGWFRDEELWNLRSSLKEMDDAFLKRKTPYTPDIALILDEESLMMNGYGSSKMVTPFLKRTGIERSGVTYGQYLLDDVLRDPPKAKLFIIAFARDLPKEKREKLEKLKSQGGFRIIEVTEGSQLSAKYIAAEAEKAGSHVYAPQGSAIICAAEDYVAVQAQRDGEIKLNFRFGPVIDALTKEKVSDGAIAPIKFKCGETRIFKRYVP